jgi:gliding motility-associated-like protein
MKKKLLYIILLSVCCRASAQDKSNRGKEFWLGYGNSISFDIADYNGLNNQEQVLYISTEQAAEVTISVNGTAWSQVINIPANSVNVSVTLPKSGPDDCRIRNEGVFDRAVHIVSTEPIVVYAHQYNTQLSGATLLLPVETYGYTYYTINYKQPPVNSWGKNWFYVIASEDNTRIQITTSDTTQGGLLPGQTITVNLNKGELYNVFGKVAEYNESDLTGSKIVSIAGSDGNCHPIAVFSGCSRLILCVTDGGEVAQQQIFPASAWGTRYLTFHSIIATSNPLTTPFLNYYRVMVDNPATVVKRNGVVLTGLQRNSFYEFSSTSGDYIEADRPVMVCQFTPNSNECTGSNLSPQGDPELMFLPAIEQGIKKARVYNTKNRNITVNYLTIIIPNEGISSLRINGAAVPASSRITHPAHAGYSIVARRLLGPASQINIESDSAFSAMIYGGGTFESYGYIAGTLINNLNSIGSIKNVYNSTGQPTTFTCPQSPFELSIKIAYRATSLQWLFSQVPGLSPARDTVIADPVPVDSQIINGRKYFTYNLTAHLIISDTGIYNIPVIYTSPEIDHCSQLEKTGITVAVKKGPVADFSYAYAGCITDTAFFTGLADVNGYNINKYTWLFNDNRVDTAITTSKKFTEPTNPVYLKVITENGCVDDTSRIVLTYPKPVAAFGYNREICKGDSVLLSDSSTVAQGNIASWLWDFADGNSTVLNNSDPFYHSYAAAGTFTVSLVVISNKGCSSDTSFLPVQVNNKPQVNFTIAGKPCTDSSFTFTPIVTANGNTIQNGYWSFGDGQTQAVNNTNTVSHAYTAAQNNVPITFVISGGSGCESDTARQNITVIHPVPQAVFNTSGGSFCPKKDIVFTYTGTDNIQSWQWDLGNGVSAAASPVSRRYNNSGNYPVSLTVHTTDGCGSVPYTMPVTIYDPPGIDAGPAILKVWNQPATLRATLADTGTYQYAWSPAADLNNPAVLNPATHTTNDVLYTLTVTGGPGNCEASDTVSVKVIRDIYIPTAFSPDNNGLHDVWNIPAINGNPNARVSIYNRWGQKIFESRGYQRPWDGTYKGVAQPMGAYYFQVQPDVNKPKVITGSVMIIR